MAHTHIEIRTDDGNCPAHVFRPAGAGPWPGVLLFMDGVGIRPALFDLAERLAAAGYYVLLPDLFYRSGPYTAPDPRQLMKDEALRNDWFSRHFKTTTTDKVMRDTATFLEHFAAQPDVEPGKLGITGYCMGGRMALAAAGTFPDRFAAAAAYHPGNVASDAPDSPHHVAPKIEARVYVGGAIEDATFPEAQKQKLEAALTAGGVDHVIETYPARHGWVPADMPTHDPAAAERHWTTLLDLFARTLKS